MIKFIKKIFQKKDKNLIAFIDIWAFWVKTIICDKSEFENWKKVNNLEKNKFWKILSEWYSKNKNFSFQNWNISDIKSLKSSVSDSLNDAENKILSSVKSVVFWLSWDFDNFMQKNFRTNIKILADEIWWKFEWFYCLNSLFCNFLNEKKSGIFVNIWSNSTNISVIQDWKFLWNENFFLWWDLFTKRISNIFSISNEEAEQIKVLYNLWKNKSSDKNGVNLNSENFKNDLDLFFTAFFVSLKNFNFNSFNENQRAEDLCWQDLKIRLPNKIYLTWWWSLFWELRDRFRSDKKYFEKLWFWWVPNLENLEFWDKFFRKEDGKSVFWGCLLMRKFYFK